MSFSVEITKENGVRKQQDFTIGRKRPQQEVIEQQCRSIFSVTGGAICERQKKTNKFVTVKKFKKDQVYVFHNFTEPPSVSKTEFFARLQDMCTTSVSKKRKSIEEQLTEHKDYSKEDIGLTFPFLNRLETSQRMFALLCEQEIVRNKATRSVESGYLNPADCWERFKREIKIPVSMGLAGVGKSTSARKSVSTHIEALGDINSYHGEDQEFVHLMGNAENVLNIRIGMDDLHTGHELSIEQKVLIQIITEALKHSAHRMADFRSRIASLFLQTDRQLTLMEVQDWLFEFANARCVLLNVDEANHLETRELQLVLEMLGKHLVQGGRVYFNVSGLYSTSITSAIGSSSMGQEDIVLPVLPMADCLQVCRALALVPASECNPHFQHLLWLSGGVPRYIARLIYCVAAKANVLSEHYFQMKDLPSMRAYIARMNHELFQDTLLMWQDECPMALRVNCPSESILENIISLCIAATPVTVECQLGTNYTVGDAMRIELLHLSPEGRVLVPPLLLHCLHRRNRTERSCSVIVLSNLSGVLSARDNESLYPSVVVHRLKAARLLHKEGESVRLSQLLGVDLLTDRDIMLGGQEPSLKRAGVTTTKKNHADQPRVNTAFVNTPTASFSNAYIRLPLSNKKNLDIYIQEKQSTVARQKSLLDITKAPKTLHSADVAEERAKVPNAGLMVFITDCAAATGEGLEDSAGTVIVTAEKRMRAFGEYVGELKKFCLSSSDIDTKTD